MLLLNNEPCGIRFEPYYSWLHFSRREPFISGEFKYDVTNPPPNKTDYIPYRDALIKQVEDFVEKYKDVHGTPEELCPLDYDETEMIKWRHDAMRTAMDNWFEVTRNDIHKIRDLDKDLKKANEKIAKLEAKLGETLERARNAEAERNEFRREANHLRNVVNCKCVRYSVAARNIFFPEERKIKLK